MVVVSLGQPPLGILNGYTNVYPIPLRTDPKLFTIETRIPLEGIYIFPYKSQFCLKGLTDVVERYDA
ncbi:hypothetical protein PUR_31310 [Paenibacillus sp. URB8-2]|nr:hypothetical protein PUR_31310 [Paenibacillus sp. URB8-2]